MLGIQNSIITNFKLIDIRLKSVEIIRLIMSIDAGNSSHLMIENASCRLCIVHRPSFRKFVEGQNVKLKDFWGVIQVATNSKGRQNSSKDQTTPLDETLVDYLLLHA